MIRCRPYTRIVTSCLYCGWREATKPWQGAVSRCPCCGRDVEHATVDFFEREELLLVNRNPAPV